MPCYNPLSAYRSRQGRDPVTGKWPLSFSIREGYADLPVTVPCGQCIGCRLERSRNWAVRCVHEASLHKHNCFLTLTYSDDNLPEGGSLNKRDIVLFLKRLRKQFGSGIRFLQCGEYGEQYARPHHHVLLFNHDFFDKYLYSQRKGIFLYRSPSLEKLWPYGMSTIGALTFESAAYVARYVLKKVTGKRRQIDAVTGEIMPNMADFHYDGLLPEYITMSRRPGIAHDWFVSNSSDVYPNDRVYVKTNVVARPPRYYDKLFELNHKEEFQIVRRIRTRKAKKYTDGGDRLYVRAIVQALKMKQCVRKFEDGGF